ncbi:MAG: hypothetical protein LBQ43_00850 [Holosporales bacterium]|jgi:hypothetical protein|nr:hypothetical protein [Holosporales bacterium]
MNLIKNLTLAAVLSSTSCTIGGLYSSVFFVAREDASIRCGDFLVPISPLSPNIKIDIEPNLFTRCGIEHIISPEQAFYVANFLDAETEELDSYGFGICKDYSVVPVNGSTKRTNGFLKLGPNGVFSCSNELSYKTTASGQVRPIGIGSLNSTGSIDGSTPKGSRGIGNRHSKKKPTGPFWYLCSNISLCS